MSKVFCRRTDNVYHGQEAEIWEEESLEGAYEGLKSLLSEDSGAVFEIFICEKALIVTADITLRSEPIDV